MGRQPMNHRDECVRDITGQAPPTQLDEQHEPSLPLDERGDRRPSLFAEHQVTFPVARDSTVLDLSWSCADQHHVFQPTRAGDPAVGGVAERVQREGNG
jgi:hypothetical protein